MKIKPGPKLQMELCHNITLYFNRSNGRNIVLHQIRRVGVSGLDVVVLFNNQTCFDSVTSLHQESIGNNVFR